MIFRCSRCRCLTLRKVRGFSILATAAMKSRNIPTWPGHAFEKYTLTNHLWTYLQNYAEKHRKAGNGFGFGLFGPDDVARTLSARYFKDGSEILIRQKGKTPRRLTPRECARLMGFDVSGRAPFRIPVSDTQAYKQFGNAVVVPVVREVAAHMAPFIVSAKSVHEKGQHVADIVDAATRSRMMSGIRSRHTKPERIVRSGLHRLGHRFVLHSRKLKGTPDLVLPKYRAVIFVHGCFWHGHECRLFRMPGTRTEFWRAKIARNRKNCRLGQKNTCRPGLAGACDMGVRAAWPVSRRSHPFLRA